MIEIEQISCSDIYPILKSYQRNIIEKLISEYGIEKAAELWVTSKGPIQTARFGGVSCDSDNSKSYWKRIKNEFDKLVCGSSEYTKEQKKFLTTGKSIGTGCMVSFANYLSPLIGLSSSILVPTLLLLLCSASKIGLKAYCSNKNIS